MFNNKGYSAIVTVFLVSTIGLILAGNISALMIARQKIVRNVLGAAQSYYTAEAGVEDAILRVIDPAIPEQTNISLSLAGSTASTTIFQSGNNITISSSGDKNNFFRNLQVALTASTEGASFNYGIQVGAGGVNISKSGVVIDGNIYSDGDIIGANSPTITGDVWASGNHKIDGFTIGGDAHAHTLEDSDITGDAYYTVITRTDVGGTNYPGSEDPPAQEMPISDTVLDGWKEDAADGGDSTGDMLIENDADLGPIKIIGNLTIMSQAIVNLTGTVWVTGNIIVQNNETAVQLDSGYGANSGVIIADGSIALQNSIRICGSEGYNETEKECNAENGSYVMLTSTKSGEDTIVMENGGSLNGILYAPYGDLTLENNVSLKEVTAYKMIVENNTVVTYEEGLANLNFSSGPGGGWEIGEWREVE